MGAGVDHRETGEVGASSRCILCHIPLALSRVVRGALSGLRSQVVYYKQPKLGLTQDFVVLLVRMF